METFKDFKQKLVIISIVLWEDHCNCNLQERICEDRLETGKSNRTLSWSPCMKWWGPETGWWLWRWRERDGFKGYWRGGDDKTVSDWTWRVGKRQKWRKSPCQAWKTGLMAGWRTTGGEAGLVEEMMTSVLLPFNPFIAPLDHGNLCSY